MVEPHARFIEPDCPVARAMARMDQAQLGQAIAALEDRRCFFGHHQRVKRPEEVQIVAIDQQFRGRQQWVEQLDRGAAQHALGTKIDQGRARLADRLRKPDNLRAEALVGGRNDDFKLGRHASERERDRQAVTDLMDLIVIEQERYAHAALSIAVETWSLARRTSITLPSAARWLATPLAIE